jgi:hypothetical protein
MGKSAAQRGKEFRQRHSMNDPNFKQKEALRHRNRRKNVSHIERKRQGRQASVRVQKMRERKRIKRVSQNLVCDEENGCTSRYSSNSTKMKAVYRYVNTRLLLLHQMGLGTPQSFQITDCSQ